jgi:ABC-type transporter Mla MlaB component
VTAVLTDEFKLEGEEVGLDQAEQIKSDGFAIIDAQAGPFQVDLAGLQKANSVTVALLVAWYRQAKLQEKTIFFMNLSEELHNIVEFSGLSRILLENPT